MNTSFSGLFLAAAAAAAAVVHALPNTHTDTQIHTDTGTHRHRYTQTQSHSFRSHPITLHLPPSSSLTRSFARVLCHGKGRRLLVRLMRLCSPRATVCLMQRFVRVLPLVDADIPGLEFTKGQVWRPGCVGVMEGE